MANNCLYKHLLFYNSSYGYTLVKRLTPNIICENIWNELELNESQNINID